MLLVFHYLRFILQDAFYLFDNVRREFRHTVVDFRFLLGARHFRRAEYPQR